MEIGLTIKHHREAQGLTQNDLAAKLYVSRQAVSKWENNSTLPSVENIVAISEILDISLDELIKGDQRVMEKLSSKSKMRSIMEFIAVGIGIAVAVMVLLTRITQISFNQIEGWTDLPVIAAGIVLLVNVDFKHMHKALNKVALAALMVIFVCWLMPGLHDAAIGFVNGWHDGMAGH